MKPITSEMEMAAANLMHQPPIHQPHHPVQIQKAVRNPKAAIHQKQQKKHQKQPRQRNSRFQRNVE